MTKDFDKKGKGYRRRYESKGRHYDSFEWDSVDDTQQEDQIKPVAKRKNTRSSHNHDKDVGTMFVTSREELYGVAKKRTNEQKNPKDYAQFRADVEEGEEDPYSIPSYGGMKVSRDVEELAEELASHKQERKGRRTNQRNQDDFEKYSDDETPEREEESYKRGVARDTKHEGRNADRSAKDAQKAQGNGRASEIKNSAVREEGNDGSEPASKPRKRSFLSKIQEAITTGHVSSSSESPKKRDDVDEGAAPFKLSAGKMRWLTQNALRLIGSEGNQSDELNDLTGRDQLEVLSKLLEAVIKSNSEPAKQSVENKQNAAPKQKASAAQVKESGSGKRASKAEEIFDEPDAEAVKKETKSPKRGSRAETKPSAETRKPKKALAESVDDFEEEYDPIAFWENFPDDEDESSDADRDGRKEPADKETKVADDFDEWDEVESKKKSAGLRKSAQDESVFETSPAFNVKRKKAAAGRQYNESGSADGSFDEFDYLEENPQKRPSGKASASKEGAKTLDRFGDLLLTKTTLKALTQMGYSEPTPIQAGVIPSIQKGLDVMGQAKTGSGKTAAFMIPIVEGVAKRDPEAGPLALAVVPTRELAVQVRDEAQKIARYRDLNVVACYGGKPIASQVSKIAKGVDILVGTPGRIIDLMKRGVLSLSYAHWVVLDEADRMLDIGFRADVELILRNTPKSRQTLLFSATLAPPVVRLAKKYMNEPEQFDFSQKDVTAETIEQFYMTVDQDRKFDALVRLLETQNPRQTIVFCRTKRHVDAVGRRLAKVFKNVEAIHGDLPQTKRDRIMHDFRSEKTKILVATDIVGRGIDVSTVSHIINFDVPQYCDDYVHRVGRAGRMGREGVAYTLVTAEEGSELTRIEIRINRLLERFEIPGFEAYSKPAEVSAPPEHKPVYGRPSRRISRAL